MNIGEILAVKRKDLVATDISFFIVGFNEIKRMKEALANRNLVANDIINIETDRGREMYTVWYRCGFEIRDVK